MVAHDGRCLVLSAGLCSLLEIQDMPASVDEFWPSFHERGNDLSQYSADLQTPSGAERAVLLDCIELAGVQLFVVRDVGAEEDADASDTLKANEVRTERLQTLGMLAGGIAHDFNNVLTGVLGHVSFLKTVLPRTGPHTDSLAAIEEGARKGASMTQQILNFSKVSAEEKPTPIELGAVVKSSVRLLKGALPVGCTLECMVPEAAMQVLAPEGRITQILINLVINSRDAVPAQGKIQVFVDATSDPDELRRAFGGADLSSVQYARVCVQDNGHGIPEEVQRRMFEPYFSTKKAMGTGLGLATVLQTVRQYGGAITVASEVGVGTQIMVYLPMLRSAAAGAVEGGPEEVLPAAGRERILIVDDEYPVRNVLSVSLEHLGYEVETASSGTEALEKYRQAPAGYDLVILDMIMPNMPGDRVFSELQRLDAGVQVLIISGYSSEAAVQTILDNGGLDFMAKPFTIEELSRKVRQCIGA
ncbi:MAG: response regulator [Proteobacteria bacterium]|nr:response regulator [Pseudomonadota bacterium]